MPMWNPWRGCKKCSEGCLYCYIHKGDAKRGVNTGMIVKTKDFDKPVAQLKKGGYKMKPGLVYLGFSTDFLIEEADTWRGECWKMIRERSDCTFLFLTKRIERFAQCVPEDWADGYENVTVCCTIENQCNADKKAVCVPNAAHQTQVYHCPAADRTRKFRAVLRWRGAGRCRRRVGQRCKTA